MLLLLPLLRSSKMSCYVLQMLTVGVGVSNFRHMAFLGTTLQPCNLLLRCWPPAGQKNEAHRRTGR